jgi:photosystem II stability/assembly factor-like uncharacterized protein
MQLTEKNISNRWAWLTTLNLLTIAAVISLWIPPAWSGNDLLSLSAVQSPRATGAILLDVTRAGQRLVAVGERGHILFSDDNGVEWQQAEVPVSVTLTAVQFPTKNKGWVVGHDGVVLHTSDGGENWDLQFDGLNANDLLLKYYEKLVNYKQGELESVDGSQKEEISFELESLLYALEDVQIAIENRALKPFLDVWFADEMTGFIIGAYGMLFRTEDGGNSWEPWGNRLENPGGFHLNAIALGRSALFIAGEAGTLYRSVNGGVDWTTLKSPYEGSFFSIVANDQNDQVYAFGLRGNAFRSDDGGNSWRRIETSVETPLFGGIVLSDGNLAIVSNKLLIVDLEKDVCLALKVNGTTYSAVTESADGKLILVGLDGVRRIEEIN